MNFDCADGKCLCVGFSKCPPPNLPRTRGRSRDSLSACGEGGGGGAMFKSLCKDTYLYRAEAKLPPTLKLTLQHSTQRSRGWGQKTPLSHIVGEGLGVRANKHPSPTLWARGKG